MRRKGQNCLSLRPKLGMVISVAEMQVPIGVPYSIVWAEVVHGAVAASLVANSNKWGQLDS